MPDETFSLEERSVDTYHPQSDLEYRLYDQKPRNNATVTTQAATPERLDLQPTHSTLASQRNSRTTLPQQKLGMFPFSTNFFDKSPAATEARKTYMKMAVGGTMLICFIIFGIFPIYWGSSWKANTHAHNIKCWVVNFDGKQVGTALTQALQSPQLQGPQFMTFEFHDASEFPNGVSDLEDAIFKQKAWLALAAAPNATDALTGSLANGGNSSYDGSQALLAIGIEARNDNAYHNIFRPFFDTVLPMITRGFAQKFATQLTTMQGVNTTAILANAPQIITAPIGYTVVNLRPFDIPVATAITFVGLIYLLILSFMVVMLLASARDMTGFERGLNTKSLILVRLGTPFIMYFFVSFFYSLLSLAFKVPFNRRFGGWGFILFWMLQWVGMLALGLALEAALIIMTLRGVPLFLVLWIITNVSIAAVPIELLPAVFRYGYAYPFYNVSEAVRTIVFGIENRLGLNFGILVAWVAVSCLTISLFTFITRRKAAQEWKSQQEDTKIGPEY